MGVAMAILKGEEMEPMDAPTVRPAASMVADTPSSGAAWTWSSPNSMREATP